MNKPVAIQSRFYFTGTHVTGNEDLETDFSKSDLTKDVMAIIFSSGTTGFPKAIPYTGQMLWDRTKLLESSES